MARRMCAFMRLLRPCSSSSYLTAHTRTLSHTKGTKRKPDHTAAAVLCYSAAAARSCYQLYQLWTFPGSSWGCSRGVVHLWAMQLACVRRMQLKGCLDRTM